MLNGTEDTEKGIRLLGLDREIQALTAGPAIRRERWGMHRCHIENCWDCRWRI